MTIKPALTAKEWAANIAAAEEGGRFKGRLHEGTVFLEDGAVNVAFDSGCASLPIDPVEAAALCLHGRLTWEMVDALRGALEETPLQSQYEALQQLLNLLESLLPPREG